MSSTVDVPCIKPLVEAEAEKLSLYPCILSINASRASFHLVGKTLFLNKCFLHVEHHLESFSRDFVGVGGFLVFEGFFGYSASDSWVNAGKIIWLHSSLV